MTDQAVPEYCLCQTLVLGCGNELFGDDGFGPAVARRLCEMADAPQGLCAMDVGTAVRQVLLDVLLGPMRPPRIVVVDAVDLPREPGEVWCIEASELPEVKLDDFSMHQLPTSNMLRELNDLGGVDVTCVVAQVSSFPEQVQPGLSEPVQNAVDRAVELILDTCRPLPDGHVPVAVAGDRSDRK
jgi:coenzyme F420 hydrogenase subunit delta